MRGDKLTWRSTATGRWASSLKAGQHNTRRRAPRRSCKGRGLLEPAHGGAHGLTSRGAAYSPGREGDDAGGWAGEDFAGVGHRESDHAGPACPTWNEHHSISIGIASSRVACRGRRRAGARANFTLPSSSPCKPGGRPNQNGGRGHKRGRRRFGGPMGPHEGVGGRRERRARRVVRLPVLGAEAISSSADRYSGDFDKRSELIDRFPHRSNGVRRLPNRFQSLLGRRPASTARLSMRGGPRRRNSRIFGRSALHAKNG